jgi:hypothetical protein
MNGELGKRLGDSGASESVAPSPTSFSPDTVAVGLDDVATSCRHPGCGCVRGRWHRRIQLKFSWKSTQSGYL